MPLSTFVSPEQKLARNYEEVESFLLKDGWQVIDCESGRYSGFHVPDAFNGQQYFTQIEYDFIRGRKVILKAGLYSLYDNPTIAQNCYVFHFQNIGNDMWMQYWPGK